MYQKPAHSLQSNFCIKSDARTGARSKVILEALEPVHDNDIETAEQAE